MPGTGRDVDLIVIIGLSVATRIEFSGVATNREGSQFITVSLSVVTKIEVFGVFTFIVSNGETQGGHL